MHGHRSIQRGTREGEGLNERIKIEKEVKEKKKKGEEMRATSERERGVEISIRANSKK